MPILNDLFDELATHRLKTLDTSAIFPETSILDANEEPNTFNNTPITAQPSTHGRCRKLDATDPININKTAVAIDKQNTVNVRDMSFNIKSHAAVDLLVATYTGTTNSHVTVDQLVATDTANINTHAAKKPFVSAEDSSVAADKAAIQDAPGIINTSATIKPSTAIDKHEDAKKFVEDNHNFAADKITAAKLNGKDHQVTDTVTDAYFAANTSKNAKQAASDHKVAETVEKS